MSPGGQHEAEITPAHDTIAIKIRRRIPSAPVHEKQCQVGTADFTISIEIGVTGTADLPGQNRKEISDSEMNRRRFLALFKFIQRARKKVTKADPFESGRHDERPLPGFELEIDLEGNATGKRLVHGMDLERSLADSRLQHQLCWKFGIENDSDRRRFLELQAEPVRVPWR